MPCLRRSALLAAVLLLALAPLSGLAAEPSASPLQPEQSGQLAGDRGGAFALYRFAYPADGSKVTLELQIRPPNASGVGLRLYGPSGEVADRTPTEPGDYLVQIYNYQHGLVADYTLVARGLPRSAQPTPAPAASAPGQPAEPTPTPSTEQGPQAPLKGALPPGRSDGQFALFEFDYPGDGSLYTVKLQITPERPDVLRTAGFRLYGPSGRLYVTGGAQPGLRPNVAGDFSSREPGTYTVQLYNYGDAAVDYEVSLQAR
ncbi:MAG TPA: hypothetical protein VG370_31835 [Chloroflexota bacterium]|jgi:hypothetical protein|nr:hypothetical protein [Chloroflexota bacterium]